MLQEKNESKIHFLHNLENKIRNSNIFSKLKLDFWKYIFFLPLIGLNERKTTKKLYPLSTALTVLQLLFIVFVNNLLTNIKYI